MTTLGISSTVRPSRAQWFRLGLLTAAAGIAAVLVVQAIALALWPELAQFRPLDSYARSALFTLVPAVGATGLLAWLASHRPWPVQTLIRIAAIVLVVSIVPDYLLPVPHRTVPASTVAAALHVVAAVVITSVLVIGYRRQTAERLG